MTVYGWDASNHDWGRRKVSLRNARKAGIALCTHKATEGDWYQDPYFPRYAKQNPGRFPVAGSYHVLNSGINVNRQTDFWVRYVNAHYKWTAHKCWLWQIDAEPLDNYPAPTLAEITACGRRLQAEHGIPAERILVYAPDWVYGDSLDGLPYRLWASNYVIGSGKYRDLYPGDDHASWDAYSGQTPLVLQYSSKSTIGKQPTCDANAIRVRTETGLQALFQSNTATPQTANVRSLNVADSNIPHDVWMWDPGANDGGTPWAFLRRNPWAIRLKRGRRNWQAGSYLTMLYVRQVQILRELQEIRKELKK